MNLCYRHQYCWSTLKIHVPPHNDKELNFLIDDDSEIEGKTESSAKALHVNPVDLLVEVGKPEDHLKNITVSSRLIIYTKLVAGLVNKQCLLINKYVVFLCRKLMYRLNI